ncbi:MAG: acyl-ACP--UDP-N-acetylglucosamine O-acyltransferase [Planctomycetes bacterium]|nr:acyl-ACP--UDP-N-acetylglucosamine O-acyltransferase [Planctomycetota bacterium]
MAKIHPSASVDPGAELDADVTVGAYSVVGDGVTIEGGTTVENGVTIVGDTRLGPGNRIFPGAVIGTAPQDLKYAGERTQVRIGAGNTIREYVTINAGTAHGGGITRVGDRNLIMACCHVAHDCIVEDDVVMANGCLLAGHVLIESGAVFGGMAAFHHFVSVGRNAFVGGASRIIQDVPPFMTVEGNPSRIWTVNVEGLRRKGWTPERIVAVKEAFRVIFRNGATSRAEACAELESRPDLTEDVSYLIEFIRRTARGRKGRAREALRDTHHAAPTPKEP